MTMGPAPMIKTLLMSVRFGIAHQPGEAVEQVAHVVRPGACFRMPLKTERRSVRAREALEGTVEERHVGRLQIGRKRSRIDGKTVVLAGDHHLAGVEVL